MSDMDGILWTIGHSTRSLDELAALLRENGVQRLVDVRSVPRSRHNPQFNLETLPVDMQARGIAFVHMAALGGLRHAHKDSSNMGWRNASFRGYADYMQTPHFAAALAELLVILRTQSTAVMCAEAVPWRCHRSLIADAVTIRGVQVRHIMAPGKWNEHKLTRFAQVKGTHITYPFTLEAGASVGNNALQ